MLTLLAMITISGIEHRPAGVEGREALVTVLAKVRNAEPGPSPPAALTCTNSGLPPVVDIPIDPVSPKSTVLKSYGIKIPARATTVSSRCSLSGGGRGTLSKTTVLARVGPMPAPSLGVLGLQHERVTGGGSDEPLAVKLGVTVINQGDGTSTPAAGILCENSVGTPGKVGAAIPGLKPRQKRTVYLEVTLPPGVRALNSTCTLQSEGSGTVGKRSEF